MKLPYRRRSERRGFTLVELMIVIAIISVLVSLVSAAVWKAVASANRVRNQNEIRQLALAVENFKQKYGVYPPSRIVLCEKYDYYFVNNNRASGVFKSTLHGDSVAILQQIWTRINFDFLNKAGLTTRGIGIDWNGNGQLDDGQVLLEGDQCLVFFLGGIPGPPASTPFTTGFSTNPQNPAFHTIAVGSETNAPLFEFSSDRLTRNTPRNAPYSVSTDPRNPLPVAPLHYSYLDTYRGAPYAYFSSNKTRNGYNRYFSIALLSNTTTPTSDCDSLGVWPYAEGLNPPRYLNPNSFQIISAGANGTMQAVHNMGFGQGTNLNKNSPIWSTILAGGTEANRGYNEPVSAPPQAGIDDQSNFHESTLGSGS